ncbi:pitrilysin family protein [Salipiger sp. PrR002]|uniref:M16 family metallopeptidase n=1 Tax=Salipiger sp. PrR002 TaxID=2706489 RepID=UPI0013B689AE|nr:pitrilysin family protein [Salipiger sp. PrR002]NDV98883.1 insulinase family protein [Salipiger sp. PrR002]NDW55620.1 insulinase family protein [Salipiger sp. PrR004]
MKSWTAALAAMVLSAMPLRAETPQKTPVTTFSLDNGMQVVVVEDHRAPVVVHMVWYKAGSADETAGTSGIAHFLEHLMFKGTDELESGEFSKVVAQNGGTDNAFTSFDQTAYHQRVAADRLGLMMEMEADRMVNLHLTEEEIATERDVILEERSMRIDNDPGALLREQMGASLYLNHRYGVPVIGWRREMEDLDRDDALAFYKRFYAPNNAILVVAGDTTPDEVRSLAEETYGKLQPNPDLAAERVRPQEPPQLAARHIEMEDPRVAQPYVMRRYLAPERDPGDQKEAAALTLLAEVLGGGQTSVLNQSLQFDQKKAIYVGAFYDGTSYDDGSFGFGMVPAPGVSLEEAEEALDAELAQFIEDGVDPEQLDRIKFQMRAAETYERDDVASVAQRYGNALTSGLTIEDVQAWPELLQEVTGEDIVAAAREVLDKRHSVTGYLSSPAGTSQAAQPGAVPPSMPQTEVTQ